MGPSRCHRFVRAAAGLLITVVLSGLHGGSAASSISANNDNTSARPELKSASLPLAFEENRGQHSREVRYAARGAGYDFVLREGGVGISLRGRQKAAAISMLFPGGRSVRPQSREPLAGQVNYFLGSDAADWRTGVPTFRRVEYPGIYDGIDALIYGDGRQLEYDFVVRPGADPRTIRVAFAGIDGSRLNQTGDLELRVGNEIIRFSKPVAYQRAENERRIVPAAYILGDSTVRFQVGDYDTTQPLIIDPVLVYSTYFGGSESDDIVSVAVDAAGNTYITGTTESPDFPVSTAAYQATLPASYFSAAFITKINKQGTAVVYSTYLGGHPSPTGGDTRATDIAVDVNGAAYITGVTSSSAFPTTAGAHQPVHGGGTDRLADYFVAKLSPSGDGLVYGSYLGGSGEEGWADNAIAVDAAGNAYVVGDTVSPDFPVTPGSLDTTRGTGRTGFAVKLNGAGAAVYATFLTGLGQTANGVAVDASGHVYVTGLVVAQLATTAGAFQPAPAFGWDAYVVKLNPTGTAFVYATYLGTSGDEVGTDIAVDPYGRAYVVGWTNAPNFPVSDVAYQRVNAGPTGTQDGFLTVFLEGGDRLWYSTMFGGTSNDVPEAIDLDQWMRATIVGYTDSTNYPVHDALQPIAGGGGQDAFITTFNRGGYALEYSSYLGGRWGESALGVAVAGAARTTIAGAMASDDFPLRNPLRTAQSCGPNLCLDGFITQMAPAAPGTISSGDIVLYAADATAISGAWRRVEDSTAAGGVRLQHPDTGAAKLNAPLANPTDYFEVTARVQQETPYTIWIRGKADNDHWTNDSVFMQFSNAIEGDNPDEAPYPNYVYQIGTTNAMAFVVEDCSGCGLRGWGWVDSGYGFKVAGPILTDFGSDEVTIRIQTREDGISIDQIVLAPFNGSPYAVQAPGFQKEDDTILPRQHGADPSGEPPPVPDGWQNGDIGQVGVAGSASYDPSTRTFTVTGSGADIWGTADELHFAHTSVTGDFHVETRVSSVENVHAWTKAGLMIRENTSAGSRHASLFVTPTNVKGLAFQRRTVENGVSISHAASGGNYLPPMWIRLTRVGNTISAAYRWTTMEPWVDFGQQTFASLPASLLVGLAVSSHVDGQLATATFDNFGVTPIATPPPPGVLPAGWSCGDLGAVATAGSCAFEEQEFTDDFTIKGSGADIWGTADELTYARHAASGDFSLTARVKFVENIDRWTKVGIMIRDWNGVGPAPAGARHASFFVTPSTEKGTAFQRRPVHDGNSVHTAGPVTQAPIWVRLVRSGDTISAYYRKEALDAWTLVGSQSYSGLPVDLSAMLVVSSHVDGRLAEGSFDNVEIVNHVPLQSINIGTTTPGSTTTSGAETIISGDGADIWGTADGFRFHYTEWVGDGLVLVRVRSLQEAHAWSKAGVMMRETLDPGSKHIMAIVSGSRGMAVQSRAVTDGSSVSSTPVVYSAPVWLGLRRTGHRFNAYYSEDGQQWNVLAPEVTIAMPDRIYLGLPVTSHSAGVLATAVFDDIIIRR
jgi:hypothetical protein